MKSVASFDGIDIKIDTLVIYKGFTVRVDKFNFTHVFGVIVVDPNFSKRELNKSVSFPYSEITGAIPSYKEYIELKDYAIRLINEKKTLIKDKETLETEIKKEARKNTSEFIDNYISKLDDIIKKI